MKRPPSAYTPVRMLDDGTPVGELGLAVGDEAALSGSSQFVMRLDSISLAAGEETLECAFDLSGFDADPDADDIDVPVCRVQVQFILQDQASGKFLNALRETRLRGGLSLGLLAALVVDQSDWLLDLPTLTLLVGPANAAAGRLNYAGGDFEPWRHSCLHELGVEPTPITVVGLGRATARQEVRGWTLTIRPPQVGVIGQVTAAVMSNGDSWKLRSRS